MDEIIILEDGTRVEVIEYDNPLKKRPRAPYYGGHSGRMRLVSLKMPEDMIEKLDELVPKYFSSRSEAIREAIKMLLSTFGDKE